jgi:hypothetical protein
MDLLNGGTLTIIPTGRFSFNTTGNIALPLIAEVSKPLYLTYVVSSTDGNKWYPSYSNTVNNLNVNASVSKSATLNVDNSLTVSGADQPLSSVVIATNDGWFGCSVAPVVLAMGMQVNISGTNTGTGSVPVGVYYIIATNTSSTFQLSTSYGGSAISTTGGTTGSLSFTCSPFIKFGKGGTVVYDDSTTKLNKFATTSSSELFGVISDPTGTAGNLVFSTSPTLTGTVTVNGKLVLNGGADLNAASLTVDDNNIELGSVVATTDVTGYISGTGLSATITNVSSLVGLIPGMTLSKQGTQPSGYSGAFGFSPVISGIDTVNNTITVTSTTANTVGNIKFDAGAASDATANGGGITLKGATNKTFTWNLTDNAWVSSIGLMTASSSISSLAWTTGGINLKLKARTYTDNSTAASSTISSRYINVIEAPTLASSNVITVTDAVNLFVTAPVAGTNSTLTNRWAILTDGDVKSTSTTDSSSSSTGAIVVSGGVGIAKKLYVGSDIASDGNITAYNSSDKRLKENIRPITNPIDKLLKLSGNTFKWTTEYYATQNTSLVKEFDVGVVAQEVQEVLPEAVHTRDNGMLAVDYQKLIPLLIECIKEQQNQINELRGN